MIFLPNLCGGGAEKLHVTLANDWVAKGFEVEFILLRKHGELINLLTPKVVVTDLNVSRIRSAILPLAERLRNNSPHILLAAMWPLTFSAALAWVISGCKSKLFLSEHSNLGLALIEKPIINRFILKGLMSVIYRLASGVIAVSHGVKQDLCRIGSISERYVRVIYNPAAIGVSSVRENPAVTAKLWGNGFDFHILAVGRLAPEKDHETLIKAFLLLPKYLNAKLIILGEGPLRNSLESLITKHNLNNFIFLPGFMINPYPWFRSADLFVLSSRFEGFGNVLVEALECGIPVVSTDCLSGPSEILANGRYGKLVSIQDPIELADAMLESLTSSHDHKALIRRANDFSVQKSSDAYLDYFYNTKAEKTEKVLKNEHSIN